MDTGIKVGDVMAKGIVTISPNDSVKRACEVMAKHDLSGITVIKKGKIAGMVTQGDLVPMIAEGKDPAKTSVQQVMGKRLLFIGPDDDISKAAGLMVKNKVKRIPVLRKGKLVGVITQTDIVKISPSVYDLIFEKAKIEAGPLLEEEIGMSGDCEECGNYSEGLRNVNGALVCEECYEDIEDRL
jgi:predicted transcriptional regulator